MYKETRYLYAANPDNILNPMALTHAEPRAFCPETKVKMAEQTIMGV